MNRPESLFSLPNLLSLARVPLAGVVWAMPWNVPGLFGTLAAAALTDWLDGWVARRWSDRRSTAGTGAWLDPLCDKVFVVSVVALVIVTRRPPEWVLPVTLLRELLQLPMLGYYHLGLSRRIRFDFRAGVLGKATTVAQFLTVAALVLDGPYAAPAILSAVLGAGAVADYAVRAFRALRTG